MKTGFLSQLIVLFGLLALSTSCRTPYTPAAASEEYSVLNSGPDSFVVVYQGQSEVSDERIVDFGLLRACHAAQERGYDYFAVVDLTRSGHERIYYNDTVIHEDLRSGLMIQGFSSRPKRVFVFKPNHLERIIKEKYKPAG